MRKSWRIIWITYRFRRYQTIQIRAASPEILRPWFRSIIIWWMRSYCQQLRRNILAQLKKNLRSSFSNSNAKAWQKWTKRNISITKIMMISSKRAPINLACSIKPISTQTRLKRWRLNWNTSNRVRSISWQCQKATFRHLGLVDNWLLKAMFMEALVHHQDQSDQDFSKIKMSITIIRKEFKILKYLNKLKVNKKILKNLMNLNLSL